MVDAAIKERTKDGGASRPPVLTVSFRAVAKQRAEESHRAFKDFVKWDSSTFFLSEKSLRDRSE